MTADLKREAFHKLKEMLRKRVIEAIPESG